LPISIPQVYERLKQAIFEDNIADAGAIKDADIGAGKHSQHDTQLFLTCAKIHKDGR
jgi:hypothetical protein